LYRYIAAALNLFSRNTSAADAGGEGDGKDAAHSDGDEDDDDDDGDNDDDDDGGGGSGGSGGGGGAPSAPPISAARTRAIAEAKHMRAFPRVRGLLTLADFPIATDTASDDFTFVARDTAETKVGGLCAS
jgi:hypothetical protein